MNNEFIREVAEQIVREQVLLNWKSYLLLGALALLANVAGNWLSSYIRKRGETFATKADMQEILRQLEATTHTTEQIRTSVSHADWVAREWKHTRRMKLEELLIVVYSLGHWLDEQRSKWIFDQTTTQHDPTDKVNLLVALYFPELKSEAALVVQAHREAMSAILDTAQKINGAGQDLTARQSAMNELLEKWKTLYPAARLSITTLENKAGELMCQIAGV